MAERCLLNFAKTIWRKLFNLYSFTVENLPSMKWYLTDRKDGVFLNSAVLYIKITLIVVMTAEILFYS